MSQKKRILLLAIAALVFGLLIFLMIRTGTKNNKEVKFEPPSYAKTEEVETYKSEFNILGFWQDDVSEHEYLRFFEDGTYIASGRFSSGKYAAFYDDGYVVLKDNYDSIEVLRFVLQNDEIVLQRDMESVPYVYRRFDLTQEEIDIIIQEASEKTYYSDPNVELSRLGTSAMLNILQQCNWIIEDSEEYTQVFFSAKEMVLYDTLHKEKFRSSYSLSYITSDDGNYHAILRLAEEDCELLITPRLYYNEIRYNLYIGAQNFVVEAKSTNTAEMTSVN